MQSTLNGIVPGAISYCKSRNRRDVPPIQSTLAYKTGLAVFAFPSFTNARALMDTAASASNASNK